MKDQTDRTEINEMLREIRGLIDEADVILKDSRKKTIGVISRLQQIVQNLDTFSQKLEQSAEDDEH